MVITPLGFILMPLAIWLLWKASKVERYDLNKISLYEKYSRLKRMRDFTGDSTDLNDFFKDMKGRIKYSGILIFFSATIFFCFIYFTIKTPDSDYHSSAWAVIFFVFIYYMQAIVLQFVMPLLDLKTLEFNEAIRLDLDDNYLSY